MAMTMSENINNMSASNDWLQFYQQQNFQGVIPSSVSDANTVTTTTVGSTTSPPLQAAMFNNVNSSSSTTSTTGHLSPEGRVGKPIRRRSRASRRTPTTLLNTDTTNFRAMVQQFTGGPSAPFAPSSSSLSSSSVSGLGLGFGFGPSRQAHLNPTGLMVAPPGYHHHQQQQLYHHQQQQNQQYVFNSNNTEGGENNNRFFQRLNNPRPPNVSDHGGFVMDQGGRFFPSSS